MKKFLFNLSDGSGVYEGNILFHPDRRRVGWYCVAEFEADGDYVTVRSPNGAVPSVLISELRREPPIVKRCGECGQVLPENS